MTAQDVKRLVEAEMAPYRERSLKLDIREKAAELISTVSLPQPAKLRVIERAVNASAELTPGGVIDHERLGQMIVREAKAEGEYLAALSPFGVRGMGTAPVQIDAKEAERRAQVAKDEQAEDVRIYESLGMPKAAAELAARGRAA